MRRTYWYLLFAVVVALIACLRPAPLKGAEEVEDTVVADENDPGVSLDGKPDAAEPAATADVAAKAPPRGKVANRFAVPDPALELADPRTYRLKIAIRIQATDAPAKGVIATAPIPMDWPEQHVRLLSQKISPHANVSEQIFKGQAAILKLQVSQIPKGGTAFVERMYEITRYRTKFKLLDEELKLPKGTPVEMKEQMAGDPPGMEIKNDKIIELAETLRTSGQATGPLETVKAFWSWTRDNIKFEPGDFRGALSAVENHCGDCEEMSALFVGMCRLSGIPARTVWVESHDYPEFYLTDKQGKGHWIPAQVLGPAWFGEMAEYRPIFQKGDRFYDPLQKTYVRYVPRTVRGADAKIAPKVQFIQDIIADSDINAPSYNNPKQGSAQ